MNIYQKIDKVRSRVGTIPKDGYNSYSGYKYVSKDALYDYFRQFLTDVGLVILPVENEITRTGRENKKGETVNVSIVEKKLQIVNVENPDEKITIATAGIGEDKTDKDGYQADTGAMKYFFINTFLVSGGDSFPGDVEHNGNDAKQNIEIVANMQEREEIKQMANDLKDFLPDSVKAKVKKIYGNGMTKDQYNELKKLLADYEAKQEEAK
jgi:hypothetical protein